jgi:DNA-binding LacI/PurR family transcriptional regulator
MVTQAQIARKLGISRQLVTFALAGYPQVSEKSRQRILAAAKQLGYSPNPHARALKRERTGIIALWVPDQVSSHYTHVARELGRILKQARHELIITEVSGAGAEQVFSHVPVDAIFAVDARNLVDTHLQMQVGRATPIISIGADCSERTDFVKVDLATGAREVMKHLLRAGLRRIAHATFIQKNRPRPGRRLAYEQAMRAAGLEPEFIYYPLSQDQRLLVRRLIQDYVGQYGRPEAIFCHSDDAALGIYRGLCDLGVRVPADVALVGCDGIQDTEYLECPLTTIRQPVAEMCATAWQLLERRLADPKAVCQEVVLKPNLVIRESSRCPKEISQLNSDR